MRIWERAGREEDEQGVEGAGRSTPSTPSRPFDIAIHGGGNVVLKISQILRYVLRLPHSLQFIQQVAAPGLQRYHGATHGDNRDLSAGLSVLRWKRFPWRGSIVMAWDSGRSAPGAI